MKIFKYLLAGLVVAVAATALVLHLQREALALKIANSILAGSGFVVSDLSIRTLNANTLHFSKLILQQADGSRYEFRGLDLPLALPSTTITRASIGELSIEFGPATDEAATISDSLDLLFGLPEKYPGLSVTIDNVRVPGLPDIEALAWQSATDRQSVRFTALAREISVTSARRPDNANRLTISALNDGGREDLGADIAVTRLGDGYDAAGSVSFDAAAVLELLENVGALAEEAPLTITGQYRADLTAAIDTDSAAGIKMSGMLVPTGEPLFEYHSPDPIITATTAGASRYEIRADYPGMEWAVTAEPFAVQANYDAVRDIAVHISELACDSTPQCTLVADARLANAAIGNLRAKRVSLGSAVTASLGKELLLTATPSSFDITGLASSDWSVARLRMTDAKALQVLLTDSGVSASSKSISLDVAGASYGADMRATLPLTLTGVEYTGSTGQFSTRISVASGAAELEWGDLNLPAPAIDSRIALRDGLGNIATKVSAPARGLDVDLDLQVLSDGMLVNLGGASLSFDRKPLSGWLMKWPYEWDIASGTATATGTLQFNGHGGEQVISGQVDIVGRDLAGLYNDMAATGIQATVPLKLGRSPGIDISGASLQVGLLDVGLPIENLSASVSWNDNSQLASISGLGMNLLGGAARAGPFDFATDSMSGNLLLVLDDIQLPLIAAMADFEAIEVSGAVSGTVPVLIDDATVTVNGGQLESAAPGGVIRYRPGTASGNDTLGLATRALSNLEYESLSSNVSYSKNGDLVLKMRIKGINPDLDPLQPVILNLNVDNNIPQLLRSLQASRDIENIIKSRGSK